MNYTKYLLVSIICLLLSCSKDNDGNLDNYTPNVKTSLPVKVVIKNANNAVTYTSNITYDNQKRLSKLVIVDQNPNQSVVQTFSYENGKIIQIFDWEDPVKPLEKCVFFYNANGMLKEEQYSNNVLVYNYEWYYRPDGGKERRIKNTSGNLVLTYYYRFSATGNLERMVADYVNNWDEDYEYTFSNFDNKLRVYPCSVISMPYFLLGFPGTNLPAPNNPQTYTTKWLTSGNISSKTIEYTYNNKNQVTVMKIKNAANGELVETRTIEYQEF